MYLCESRSGISCAIWKFLIEGAGGACGKLWNWCVVDGRWWQGSSYGLWWRIVWIEVSSGTLMTAAVMIQIASWSLLNIFLPSNWNFPCSIFQLLSPFYPLLKLCCLKESYMGCSKDTNQFPHILLLCWIWIRKRELENHSVLKSCHMTLVSSVNYT